MEGLLLLEMGFLFVPLFFFGFVFSNSKITFNLLKQALMFLPDVKVLWMCDITTLSPFILVKVVCLELLKRVQYPDCGIHG